MKKFILISIIGLLFSGLAAGCGANNDDMNEQGMNTTGNDNALKRVGYDQEKPRDSMDINDPGTRDTVRENYSISNEAADRVADLNEVSRAYVLTTERSAYVAAVFENGENGEVSKEMKDKIANQIRKVDAGIKDVYVTTNPDFVDRMRNYADKAEGGKPIEGIGEELTDALQRVFPDRR
jgi:spore cortex protein